jgi:hypothetical protein
VRVNLGFWSLRTLEGQFGPLGERTLLSVMRTYRGDHQTYALQTVQQTYVGPLDIRYFLEYPVVNTWMYEAAFGPLENSTGRTLGWLDVRYFCQGVGSNPLL